MLDEVVAVEINKSRNGGGFMVRVTQEAIGKVDPALASLLAAGVPLHVALASVGQARQFYHVENNNIFFSFCHTVWRAVSHLTFDFIFRS